MYRLSSHRLLRLECKFYFVGLSIAPEEQIFKDFRTFVGKAIVILAPDSAAARLTTVKAGVYNHKRHEAYKKGVRKQYERDLFLRRVWGRTGGFD